MLDTTGNWPSWKTIFKIAVTIVAVTAVAAVAVASLGAAGVAAGVVSAAIVKSAVIGTVTGGVVAGSVNAIAQGVTKGGDNIDCKEVAVSTFIGNTTGALSGGVSAISSIAATSGMVSSIGQKSFQAAANACISGSAYVLTTPEPTLAGFTTSVVGGFVSGRIFNFSKGEIGRNIYYGNAAS